MNVPADSEKFPKMLLVRQNFPDRALRDIPGTVREELSGSGIGANLKPGSSIAIGVGKIGRAHV